MKQAWQELNKKITASTLANKETLAYILKTRRTTALQKLIRADLCSSLFLALFTIGMMIFCCLINNGATWIKIQMIGILLVATTLNIIDYLKLTRMKPDESVTMLYKQVASYMKLTIWSYLICYALVFVFLVSTLLTYPLPHFAKVLLFFIIPAGVAVDCFIFHWSSNHIQTLVDTSKELKELNQ